MPAELPQSFRDPDEELLQRISAAPEGDLRAFEELVHRHQGRIVADCRFLTRDEAYSEDLAQEVFVKAYFAMQSFEGRSTFRSWLQRIKVHHCLNHLKQHQKRDPLPIDEEAAESLEQMHVPAVAERDLETADHRKQIDAILQTMPSTLRIPLVMRDMDELSYEEIATALGLGLSAVKMRIKRARELFRRSYESGHPVQEGTSAQ
jgi:RNA polymerase sigma-70 factor (ECF subfamily)